MPIPHKWHFFAKNLAQLIILLYLCSRKGLTTLLVRYGNNTIRWRNTAQFGYHC